jgi:hypothetical protein
MTLEANSAVAEGWYPLDAQPGYVRYWDGEAWSGDLYLITPEIAKSMRSAAEAHLKDNNAGIVSFVTALVGFLGSMFIPGLIIIAPLCGAAAVVYGILCLARARTRKHTARWPAIAGIVIGTASIVIGLDVYLNIVLHPIA